MPQTIEALARVCHDALSTNPGLEGQEQARQALMAALANPKFVDAQFDETAEGGPAKRQTLYEDADLGFRIVAHADQGANDGNPHDHGPTWAIYGQAKGQTRMTEWRIIEAATQDSPAVVEPAKNYLMTPGDVVIYGEGVVHSPIRESDTRLIRIEGRNLDDVKRPKYQAR